MTARLLSDKDLTALLCRYLHNASPAILADSYGITRDQVAGLLNTHHKKMKGMKSFLGLHRRLPARSEPKKPREPEHSIWRKCNRCRKDFFTSQFIFSCDTCHHRADFKDGSGYTTMAWRGAG